MCSVQFRQVRLCIFCIMYCVLRFPPKCVYFVSYVVYWGSLPSVTVCVYFVSCIEVLRQVWLCVYLSVWVFGAGGPWVLAHHLHNIIIIIIIIIAIIINVVIVIRPMGRSTVLETVLDMVWVVEPPPAPPAHHWRTSGKQAPKPLRNDQTVVASGNLANCTGSSQEGEQSWTGIWWMSTVLRITLNQGGFPSRQMWIDQKSESSPPSPIKQKQKNSRHQATQQVANCTSQQLVQVKVSANTFFSYVISSKVWILRNLGTRRAFERRNWFPLGF